MSQRLHIDPLTPKYVYIYIYINRPFFPLGPTHFRGSPSLEVMKLKEAQNVQAIKEF